MDAEWTGTDMPETIGFVGLGLMGQAMARNLIRAGNRLRLHNRTRARAEALEGKDVEICSSPAEAARGATHVITMVGDVPDLETVLWGEQGVLSGLGSGSVLVQMSTVSREQVRRAADDCARRGASFLDAPVTGGKVGAEEGTLTVMIGGEAEVLERARGILAPVARTVVHVGGVGAATLVKLALNVLQAGMVELLAETLVLCKRGGARVEPFLEVMGASAGGAPLLKLKGAALRDADTTPQFSLKWMDKDLKLAAAEGKVLDAALPVSTAVGALYSAAQERGLGEEDYVAVARLLEQLNEVEIAARAPRPGTDSG
jgi:3-hydroxyisobutyrate dehydrogenase-like beta-hydroxyacid dehydrogenase